MHARRTIAAAWACLAAAVPATAQQPPPPDYGFDFVTIGDAGNAAYDGIDLVEFVTGRGSVAYEYRIARLETRTSQFVEFMNVLGRLDPVTADFSRPAIWGAFGVPQSDGTIRFELVDNPIAGDVPVSGISWRLAAIYTNWLHNDKAATLDALNNGAYDTSTFIRDPNGFELLDQTTRNPDARYWIPSLDEWLKAAHYDPNRNGPGEGGWWQYSNGTDEPLQEGLPGEPGAETSYKLDIPGFSELTIPVGSYPETQSPWGLLDVSGGASEWTESWRPDFAGQFDRFWTGSLAGSRGLREFWCRPRPCLASGSRDPDYCYRWGWTSDRIRDPEPGQRGAARDHGGRRRSPAAALSHRLRTPGSGPRPRRAAEAFGSPHGPFGGPPTALVVDPEALCVDREGLAVDEERLCVDRERLAVDEKRLCVDREGLAVDEERLTVDRERLAVDEERLTVDRLPFTGGHMGPSDTGSDRTRLGRTRLGPPCRPENPGGPARTGPDPFPIDPPPHHHTLPPSHPLPTSPFPTSPPRHSPLATPHSPLPTRYTHPAQGAPDGRGEKGKR